MLTTPCHSDSTQQESTRNPCAPNSEIGDFTAVLVKLGGTLPCRGAGGVSAGRLRRELGGTRSTRIGATHDPPHQSLARLCAGTAHTRSTRPNHERRGNLHQQKRLHCPCQLIMQRAPRRPSASLRPCFYSSGHVSKHKRVRYPSQTPCTRATNRSDRVSPQCCGAPRTTGFADSWARSVAGRRRG